MSINIKAARGADLRSRLATPITGSAFWSWAGPLLVTGFGAALRFSRLGVPHAVIFDEAYYVPDAYGILTHGVEITPVLNANALLARGSTHILMGNRAEFVAHPPLGKVAIAGGEWLFGLTPFGWRFAAALVGSLAILMTARIARRMTRSTLLGCVAGLLLALDGLEFVLSRTAILDIFLMFWVLAAFGLIVIDRDRTRARLAAAAAEPGETGGTSTTRDTTGNTAGDVGPRPGIRWPLLLAGVCLGCACATKWSGVWYILAFGGLVIAWDVAACPGDGLGPRLRRVARSDGRWLPLFFGIVPAAVYVAAWTGWFASGDGFDRSGAALNHGHTQPALLAWLQYNRRMLSFGLGQTNYAPYHSNPLTWLILARPTAFYSICSPVNTCGTAAAPNPSEQEVLAIGTPLIWWAACLALLVCLAWWVLRRDWRAAAMLAGVAAGWLPWVFFYFVYHRTEFSFYAVVFDPFLVIAITLCFDLLLGPAGGNSLRRSAAITACGAYLLAVVANFAYFYPVLAGKTLPYGSWLARMWFHSWI